MRNGSKWVARLPIDVAAGGKTWLSARIDSEGRWGAICRCCRRAGLDYPWAHGVGSAVQICHLLKHHESSAHKAAAR
eukprot:15279877-Alexandrium_andersonii.AAC.1